MIRHQKTILFLFLTTIVVAVETMVVHASTLAGNTTHLLALGVTIDLIAGLPLLYYLLFIRSQQKSTRSLIPIIFLASAIAYLVLPADMELYLNQLRYLFFILDLFVLYKILFNFRTIYRGYRANQSARPELPGIIHFEKAMHQQFAGSLLIRFIMTELLIYYYLIFGRKISYPSQSLTPFSYHRKGNGGIIVGVLVAVSIVEMTVVHVILDLVLHIPKIAWIITGLSIYSLFWIVGDYQAMKARPILLMEKTLLIQTGIRWQVSVPLDQILSTRFIANKSELQNFSADYISLSSGRSPNIMIQLNQEVEAIGLFGRTVTASNFAVAVDDPDFFLKAIRSRLYH